MAQKPPAFQFYPADFLVGTLSFTTEEVGAYMLLLCHQWDSGHLPADQEKCARLARCQASTVASIWHKFGISEGGKVWNQRLEAEREKQASYREKQAGNGAKRWKKSGGTPTAEPSLSGGTPTAEPSLSGGTPTAEPSLSGGIGLRGQCSSSSSSSSIVPPFGPQGDQLEPAAVDAVAAEKKEGGRAAAQIASEAGVRILAMFAPATQLSPVCFGQLLEHVATGTLPADEKKWRALEAMRAERAAITGIPEDRNLCFAWLFSKERLCRDLAEAFDTAAAVRPQGTPDARTAEKKEAPPADWQAKLTTIYPQAQVPTDFYALPADIRREITEKGAA